jgi:excisionase family DNA binding protein
MSTPSRFLSPAQAALESDSSVPTIYRMLARGEISAVKIGRSSKIPRESFEAYLNSRPKLVSRLAVTPSRKASQTEVAI